MIRLHVQTAVYLSTSLLLCAAALGQDRAEADSLYEAAASHHDAGRFDEAVRLYSSVIEADSNHADAYWNRANLLLSAGRHRQAAADYRSVARLVPSFAPAVGSLGWALILAGDAADARRPSRRAFEMDPQPFAWPLNLGHTYLLTGMQDSARVYYGAALERMQSRADLDASVADFTLFVDRSFCDERCRTASRWLIAEFEDVYRFQITADSLADVAGQLESNGTLDQAADAYLASAEEESRGRNPRPGVAATRRARAGRALVRSGDPESAMAPFTSAAADSAAVPPEERQEIVITVIESGQLAFGMGRYDAALTLYDLAESLLANGMAPERALLLNNRAAISMNRGRYEEAAEGFERAIDLYRTSGNELLATPVQINLAGLYATLGEFDRAADIYVRVDSLADVAGDVRLKAFALNNLGFTYHSWGRFDDALSELESARWIAEAGQIHDLLVAVYSNQGLVHLSRGNLPDAQTMFERGLVLADSLGKDLERATITGNLGRVHARSGRFADAMIMLEQSRAIAAEHGFALQVVDATNNIGSVHFFRGDYERALEAFRLALESAESLGLRAGLSGILNSIGNVHEERGDLDEALTYFERALDLDRSLGNRASVVVGLNNVGKIHMARGDFDSAGRVFDEALRTARENNLRIERGITQANIGLVLAKMNRYDQAIAALDGALRLAEETGDPDAIVARSVSKGGILAQWGRYDEARDLFLSALSLAEGNERTSHVAGIRNHLGSIYTSWGRYDEAQLHYENALELNRELGRRGDEALVLNNLGHLASENSRPRQALSYYQQALDQWQRMGRKDMHATVLSNMASVYVDQGDLDRSLELHEEALAVRQSLDIPGDVATSLSNIGLLYQIRRQPEMALEYYLDALQLLRPLGVLPAIAAVVGNVASAYVDLKNYDEAFRFWDEALDITETIRETAAGDVRRDYMDKEIATYRVLLHALLEAGREDRVLETLERMNARFLAEQISSDSTAQIPEPDPEGWQRAADPDEAYILTGNFSTPLTSVTVVATDSLTVHARSDSAHVAQILTDFHEYIDIGESVLYEQKVNAIVDYYRTILGRSDEATRGAAARPAEQATSHGQALGRAFYDMLIGPIESELANRTKLTIVPDGPLALLPFEAFVRPDGTYLGEHFEIRYIQSLAVLDLLRSRQYGEPRAPVLAFGDAVYDASRTGGLVRAESTEQARALRNSITNTLSRGGDQSGSYDVLGYGTWTDLPGTAHEVAAIGESFSEAVVVTGAYVSEERVKSMSVAGALSQYRVIHFATHGIVVPDVPELSALVLSQDSTGAEDGYLRMGEILDLNLRTDFVNLSACETGLGKLYGGEGVVGLTQAFMVAGANSLSVSLWQVADVSTSLFMETLYGVAGTEVREYGQAMAHVKRMFIRGEFGDEYRDPYYWAPFVFYGR